MSALNFDPDKHRDPHEPEHHWALRRRFLEHNMGRYTEEKLVSLAQVFANMEFLGCRCVCNCHVSPFLLAAKPRSSMCYSLLKTRVIHYSLVSVMAMSLTFLFDSVCPCRRRL